MPIQLNVNGQTHTVDAPGDKPLLWVLREDLALTGTKYGCGIAQCGVCTVHLNGQPVRSCMIPLSAAADGDVITIEGAKDTCSQCRAAGVARTRCRAVRLLPAGSDDVCQRIVVRKCKAQRCRHRQCHAGQSLPLRDLSQNPRRNTPRRRHPGGLSHAGSYRQTTTLPTDERADVPPQFSAGHRPGRRRLHCRLRAETAGYRHEPESPDEAPASKPSSLNAFVRVGSDNTITVMIKHLDKGQGVTTGLPTIVAEEMDAAWSQMRAAFAPADAELYKNLFFGVQGTGGSTSIANSWQQLRIAAAAARSMLVQAAAAQWDVPANEISVADGIVSHGASARSGFVRRSRRRRFAHDTAGRADPERSCRLHADRHQAAATGQPGQDRRQRDVYDRSVTARHAARRSRASTEVWRNGRFIR